MSAIGQPRSSQRYEAKSLADEDEITAQIVELSGSYGRYGYRMITALLRGCGYEINYKRVYRIWRSLGSKVPKNSQNEDGCGSVTEVASACEQNIRTMFGAMIL